MNCTSDIARLCCDPLAIRPNPSARGARDPAAQICRTMQKEVAKELQDTKTRLEKQATIDLGTVGGIDVGGHTTSIVQG
eukprot:COSAG02_NODE_4338_length_5486_cov_2.268053_3_plen_79_part_00